MLRHRDHLQQRRGQPHDQHVQRAQAVRRHTSDIFVDAAGTTGGAYTVDIYTSPTSGVRKVESCGRPTRITNTPIIGNTTAYRDDYSAAEAMLTCSATTVRL